MCVCVCQLCGTNSAYIAVASGTAWAAWSTCERCPTTASCRFKMDMPLPSASCSLLSSRYLWSLVSTRTHVYPRVHWFAAECVSMRVCGVFRAESTGQRRLDICCIGQQPGWCSGLLRTRRASHTDTGGGCEEKPSTTSFSQVGGAVNAVVSFDIGASPNTRRTYWLFSFAFQGGSSSKCRLHPIVHGSGERGDGSSDGRPQVALSNYTLHSYGARSRLEISLRACSSSVERPLSMRDAKGSTPF
jgi:hypothetical protein